MPDVGELRAALKIIVILAKGSTWDDEELRAIREVAEKALRDDADDPMLLCSRCGERPVRGMSNGLCAECVEDRSAR